MFLYNKSAEHSHLIHFFPSKYISLRKFFFAKLPNKLCLVRKGHQFLPRLAFLMKDWLLQMSFPSQVAALPSGVEHNTTSSRPLLLSARGILNAIRPILKDHNLFHFLRNAEVNPSQASNDAARIVNGGDACSDA